MGADGSATRLSRDTLSRLDRRLRPRARPEEIGIVHLGLGAFHRAHQAVYTEDALAIEAGGWGICGVSQRSRAALRRLEPQDGLYSVIERSDGGERLRVVGVLNEMFPAWDADRLRERLAAPTTHIVTITVTEKGYWHDAGTGRLRTDSAEVAADLAGRAARTMIGQLVRGLQARTRSDAPLTVLSCDNLPGNGRLVSSLVQDFCSRLPPAEGKPLASWVEERVSFPSSVVDRIVPAATEADRADAERLLGVADHAVVVTEPYRQWVIEDRFAGPRPAWDKAGVLLVGDIGPYEAMKLRLVNAPHSALAYLGLRRGYRSVAEAFADASLRHMVEGLMEELLPTLPDGDAREYAVDVRRRFSNRAITHTLAQIAEDGSHKLRQRLFDPAVELLAAGTLPDWTCLAVAGWIGHLRDAADLRDPLADRLRETVARAAGPAEAVDGVLRLPSVAPAELAEHREFRATVAARLADLPPLTSGT